MSKIRSVLHKAFRRFEAQIGALILAWRLVEWLIGKAGDVDFVMSKWNTLSDLLNSNWAIGLSVFLGFLLIARAISKTREQEGSAAYLKQYLSGRLKAEIEKEIVGETFYSERIQIDGIRYVKCKFFQCKFIYNGGVVDLEGCEIFGMLLATDDPAIQNFGNMMNLLGFLDVPIATDEGILPPKEMFERFLVKNNRVAGVTTKPPSKKLSQVLSTIEQVEGFINSGVHDTECLVRGNIKFEPSYTKPLLLAPRQ